MNFLSDNEHILVTPLPIGAEGLEAIYITKGPIFRCKMMDKVFWVVPPPTLHVQ